MFNSWDPQYSQAHIRHHDEHMTKKDASWVRRQRQRMNFVAICQALFLPWILFCVVCGAASFRCHYCINWVFYGVLFVAAIIVLLTLNQALKGFRAKMREDVSAEPTWFMFIFISMAIAVVVGLILGNQIFGNFMQRYQDYLNLNDYSLVDVTRMRGQQLMDGARLNFVEGTTLDMRKAIGFQNLRTYCVVPLTVADKNGVVNELANYDFWAVGLDCCSGDNTDYHCGEFNNTNARGGLRLLEDEDRSFYRLAVQQAEGMYHIHADHPLFLYWTEDPVTEMDSWKRDAYKFFYLAMLVHFFFQLLCVALGVAAFSKMAMY